MAARPRRPEGLAGGLGRPEPVRAGGLLSYAPRDEYPRAARQIDLILKGARPADLPLESPTRFHIAVNLEAARGLGIAVPQSILSRADEVIE